MKQNRKKQIELSAIMLCAALLSVSLLNLAAHIREEAHPASLVGSASPVDPYPELYALQAEGMVPDLESNIVYLTFDDGPSENTRRILEILEQYGAKATFFVTAQTWEQDYLAAMYGRIVEEGHTLGLHSYTHDFDQIYASPTNYLQDIDRLRQMVEESCGYRPSILRFPGGSSTTHASRHTMDTLIDEIDRRGYLWYNWDIPTGDDRVPARSAEEIAQTIIKGVQGRSAATIVLCHDNSTPKTTPDAIGMALETLTAQGYEFHALPSGHVVAPAE